MVGSTDFTDKKSLLEELDSLLKRVVVLKGPQMEPYYGGSSNFLLCSVSCFTTGGDVAAVSPDAADSAERKSTEATNFWRSSSFLKRHSFNLFANGFTSESRKRWA